MILVRLTPSHAMAWCGISLLLSLQALFRAKHSWLNSSPFSGLVIVQTFNDAPKDVCLRCYRCWIPWISHEFPFASCNAQRGLLPPPPFSCFPLHCAATLNRIGGGMGSSCASFPSTHNPWMHTPGLIVNPQGRCCTPLGRHVHHPSTDAWRSFFVSSCYITNLFSPSSACSSFASTLLSVWVSEFPNPLL